MRELLMALVGGGVAFVLWRTVKNAMDHGHFVVAGSGFSATRGPTNVASDEVFEWPRLGRFEFDVADTAQYQQALRRLAEQGSDASLHTPRIATLHPGASGRDTGAPVEVRVEGVRVGFLSDGDATRFHRRLAFEGRPGQLSRCEAVIDAVDTGRRGDKRIYGVQLDLKPFRH